MKIKFFKQRDMMDCGAACLQSICHFYGKTIDLTLIRAVCHITCNGVSMLGLADAARSIGFKTIGVKLNWMMLSSDVRLPCIIHWKQEHFIVVLSIKKDFVKVMDPAVGILSYKKSEFLKSWLNLQTTKSNMMGAALLLVPSSQFYDLIQSPKHTVRIRTYLDSLSPYKAKIFRIILCMIIGSVISLIFPILTKQIVDVGIKNSDINYIYLIFIAEFALIIGQIINNVIRSQVMLTVTTNLSIDLISDFLERLMKLPIFFFDSKHIGDILQRMKDFNRVENFLTGTLLSLILSLITFIVYGAMMLSFSFKILSIFFIGSVLYVIWSIRFIDKRKKLDYMQFQYLASNQSSIIQMISGMQEIKLNSCERKKCCEWKCLQHHLYRIKLYSLRLANIQNSGSKLIDQLKNMMIIFFAVRGVIDGIISIGELVAIQYIIGQLNAPLYQFITFIHAFQDANISLERMHEINSLTEEEKLSAHEKNPPLSNSVISIHNLTFQYDGPHSRKVLDNLNFDIFPKKITAIVGMSGSGKTTFLKLLLSFYQPIEGSITIGNTPLQRISPREWRKHCGVVMQDGFIFSDTIANNIAISDSFVNMDMVIESAKIANIHDHIMSLPMKYNTKIGPDGQGLSSGQKQRLLIARAVYKNPDFIFLDEATNALDAKNERAIVENLNKFYEGRTVVVVAHRLSTVKNADQIVVIDGGKIVETGNHTTLIKQRGAYYNLVKNQLELGN